MKMIKELKIADYVTLMNLLSGIISVYFAFQKELLLASAFMILGVFFDKIDGFIARKLNQESDIGAELDSLSDLVTFGIAPAALISNLFNNNWVSLISLLLPICGSLRLARYNITRKQTQEHFTGVPITTNGVVFPFLFIIKANMILSIFVIVLMCILMISTIKMKKVFK